MSDPFIFIGWRGFRLAASGWLAMVALIVIAAVAAGLLGLW